MRAQKVRMLRGEHCQVNVRSGRCASGVCKNGGTCVNLLIGGFHCVCPPGEYEHPYCEVSTRSFPPQSFVTFRGLRQRFHFTVSLSPGPRRRLYFSVFSNGWCSPGGHHPNIGHLGLPHGPSGEKVAVVTVDDCDSAVAVHFGSYVGNYSCAAQGTQSGSKKTILSILVSSGPQPNIGHLGLPHGPSGEKVAVVTVDDCDSAVAVHFGSYVGNYSCAAQGTQSGSKKSLDLTGPLLLGGVPNLPEDFPVHSRQFVGCMRNLSVDGRIVDMAAFIANNGTRAGCASQRNFCDGTSCQNGGTCVNKWNTYLCECPLRFGGKNCEQGKNLFLHPKPQWCTWEGNTGNKQSEILNSYIQFEVSHGPNDVASMQLSKSRITDGEWHHVLIELRSAKEGKDIKYLAVMTLDYGMDQGVRMGETSTNIATLNMNDALKVRVKDGCDVEDPCASSPCPPHSHCRDTWDSYSCVCDRGGALTSHHNRGSFGGYSASGETDMGCQLPWSNQ
ncbi:hypothetical protein NN561_019963 [Cricetulus griseus]